MLELPNHDRNANVPPTPPNDALTIPTTTEQHNPSDQTSPRPSKRHCTYPYISPSLGHAATEVHLLAEVETEAEATPEAEAEAIPEAEAAQVPYPLTADNLATLPDHSVTYHTSPKSIPTSTASTSPFLHQPDHVSTYSLAEMTVSEARTLLERNRLYMFKNDAQERAKAIIKAGKQILGRRRKSDMSDPILEALVLTIRKYANKGEATFLFHFWKALLNDFRQVPELEPDREFTSEDDPKLFKWYEKAWDKDYIWGKMNADFASNGLPRFEKSGNPVEDAVFSLIPRITSPRPDIAYGFEDDAFEENHQQVLPKMTGGKITNQQFCTFFAVEAKCGERSIEEAENQCCRTGATMAKSRRDMNRALIDKRTLLRNLRASIATPSQSTEVDLAAPTSGPVIPTQTPPSNISIEQPSTASNGPTQDLDTISFTLAVCPQIAKMSIHFAETWSNGRIEWQMHELKSYLLQDYRYLQDLHHDIDNILDWGCTTRKKQITAQAAEYLQIIVDIQEAQGAKSTTEASQTIASTPGSKRKRGGL